MKQAKIFYTATIVLTLIVMCLGSTFAYFASSATTDKNTKLAEAANYSLNLSVTPKYPDPQNGPYTIIPMKDVLSDKGYIGYDNVPCIDKNGAPVCYVYEIIAYGYNDEIEYLSGSITVETDNINSLSYRIFDENNQPIAITEDEEENPIYYQNAISGQEMTIGNAFDVKDKEQITLNLMIWLTDTGVPQNETDIGTFKGHITIYVGMGGQITGKISSAIEGSYVG